MTSEYKNVFIGRNPDTGKPYFRRVKVAPVTVDPCEPPEGPPTDPSLMTAEEYAQSKRDELSAEFERYQLSRPDLYKD